MKEYDCVLIYDEELGVSGRSVVFCWIQLVTLLQTFTLEKVECFMGFTYDKKVSSSSSSFARKSRKLSTW